MNNDLISREALKKALNYIYDCAYIASKSKEGIASDIIAEIDNAPTVEYTFEEAFQKTVCENKLYCPSRQKGEWRYVIRSNFPQYEPICRCSICKGIGGKLDKFCKHCGADMQGNEK